MTTAQDEVSEKDKEELFPIIYNKAVEFFSSLAEPNKIYSRKEQLVIFNTLMLSLAMAQNSFFEYKDRDAFADSIAAAMKANKGPEPSEPTVTLASTSPEPVED